MTQEIAVVYSADDNYAQHAGVSIISILENLNSNYRLRVYLIDGGISKENKEKLVEAVKKYNAAIMFLHPEKIDYDAFSKRTHITVPTYFRLSVASLLPRDVKRVLYLDCDLIVIGDISALWRMSLEENVLAAVPNFGHDPDSLGVGVDMSNYFNAGVMFIDLKNWRAEKVGEKAFSYLGLYRDRVIYQDQDALNYVVGKKWVSLPTKYNIQSTMITNRRLNLSDTIIIHFTDQDKPWHYLCSHPWSFCYSQYLKLSPWKGFVAVDKNLINVSLKFAKLFYQKTIPWKIRNKLKIRTRLGL